MVGNGKPSEMQWGHLSPPDYSNRLSIPSFCPFLMAAAAKGVQGSLPYPKIGNWMVRAKSHFHVSDPRTRSRDRDGADCEGPVILQIVLRYFKPDSGIFPANASGKDRSSPQNSIQSDAVPPFESENFLSPSNGTRAETRKARTSSPQAGWGPRAGQVLSYMWGQMSSLARVLALKGLRLPRGGPGNGFRDSKADHRCTPQWAAGKVPELEAGKTQRPQIWDLQAMLRVSLF